MPPADSCLEVSLWARFAVAARQALGIKRRHLPSSLGLPIRFFHEAVHSVKLKYRAIAVRGSVRGEIGAPELGEP